MNISKRGWPLAALSTLVAASAAFGGACSGGDAGERGDRLATVSQAELDQPAMTGFEPTVAINPTNPANIAFANGNGIQISNDGGQHFQSGTFAFPAGVGSNSDPSLAFDSAGRLFWSLLGNYDVYVEQVDTVTALPAKGTVAVNVSASITNYQTGTSDKEWIAADRFPGSQCKDFVYAAFEGPGGMRFSRSTPPTAGAAAGATWSTLPSPVNDPSDNTASMIHVAVGADGAVYIAYHSAVGSAPNNDNPDGTTGQIIVKRSDDCGKTFPSANKWVAFAPGYADLSYNYQYLCTQPGNGGVCVNGTPNVPRKLPRNQNLMIGSTQPWLLPDPTNPKILTVITSDDPSIPANGNASDYAAVYLGRSVNQGRNATGVTWSSLIQVDGDVPSSPKHSLQFMPTASMDTSTSSRCLVASYYDNRNYTNNNALNSNGNAYLDVFLRASADDGTSWGPELRLEGTRIDPDFGTFGWNVPTAPLPANYVYTNRIGEYNGVAVAHGVAHAVWMGNGTNGMQIFYNNARMCTDPTMPRPSGNLVAAAQSNSITDLFAVGNNGGLYRRWVSGTGSWQGPSPIGGFNLAPDGAPLAVGRLNANELYVFFVSNDGRLYYAYETNDGAWQGPTAMTGTGFAKSGAYLATGVQSATQLDVFVVDTNGTLQGFARQNGTPWSANIPLANNFAPSGAALATAAHPSVDQLDVFAIGTDGSVVATFADGLGPFVPPGSLTAANVAYPGSPIATGMQGTDQLDVFYTGRDGAIYAIWFVDTSQVFGPLALTATSSFPSGALATIQRGTTLNLFAVNDSGAAAWLRVDGTGSWKGPTTRTIADDAFQGAGISAAAQGNLTDLFILGKVYLLEATFDGSSWSSAMPLLP